ncbi:hypothetical protein [Nocardioides antri]|uniref:Uncharacterized protein n=1 Tax=Nocardioides antri TaxID=2607659 RepID=A0A5B1M166_9ACTN|nr:hypothetical protein [Nocardioides antri]KAA1426663.1 hypothetical protein F0U47_13030 [Nocardioides antri]
MKRVLLAIAAATLVLGGTATPAAAESGSVSDPSGDAPARIDITRLKVDNDKRWFTMRVDVQDLRQKGIFHFHYWRGTSGVPMQSLIVVVKRIDGETRARFFACGFEDCRPETCPRLRARWRSDTDFVRISAPQRCYPRPRTRPDAPPPAAGQFFVYSRLGKGAVDDHEEQVELQRG